jgi:uncharacterized iron-regulated protein
MRTIPLLALAGAAALMLGGCTPPGPDAPRGYAFRVPPGVTFDLTRAQVLTPQVQGDRLEGVALLFLGEHHEDSRSHAAQLTILNLLQERGRLITVALEMFPPEANEALDAWRLGRLEETEFLERSQWYRHWGYPWHAYRELFLWFREQQIPLRGINVDEQARAAARRNRLEKLPPALREEAGELRMVLEPHRDLLLEQLRAAGHAGDLAPDSDQFAGFLRVQTLWERVMGRRAARMAEALPPRGIVVVLIGSGHLAYKLGANLQAAQVSTVPQLSLWDTVVKKEALDSQGRGYIPVGVSDWARLYAGSGFVTRYPSLVGLKLSSVPSGVRVDAVLPFTAAWLRALRPGDVIREVNGVLTGTPTRLRHTCESLPWDRPAEVTLERDGMLTLLTLTPRQESR